MYNKLTSSVRALKSTSGLLRACKHGRLAHAGSTLYGRWSYNEEALRLKQLDNSLQATDTDSDTLGERGQNVSPLQFQQQSLICLITCYRTKHLSRKIVSPWVREYSVYRIIRSQGREDVKSKHTKPYPGIFFTLKRNYSVKDVGMDKASYIYLHFCILPFYFLFFLACHRYIFSFFLFSYFFRDVLISLIFSVTCGVNTISSANKTPLFKSSWLLFI